MLDLTPILADSDGLGKVIAFIVVLVIWGVGALASLAKKQNAQAQQQREAMERAMYEQMEEARRRGGIAQSLEQMSGSTVSRPPPVPVPPQAMRNRVPVPPMRSVGMPPPIPQAVRRTALGARQAQAQRPAKKAQRRQAGAVPPRVPRVPAVPVQPELAEWSDTPEVLVSEIGAGDVAASPTRRQSAGAKSAGALGRLTPRTLRQQFILTELLQPPLALRERPPGI